MVGSSLPGELGQMALDRDFPRSAADGLEADELAGKVDEAAFVRAHPAIVLHVHARVGILGCLG